MVSATLKSASGVRSGRNVAVLVAAQAFLGAQMPIHFVLAGLAGQILSPIPCLVTLPVTTTVFATMVAAPFLANLMQRKGRRTGFVLGTAGGALGGAFCVIGLLRGSFGLFLFGSGLLGLYMSAQGFYRFAATDGASEGFRPKAVSYVMAAGLVSAILGPQLVKLTADWLAPIPFAGAYLAVVLVNLAGFWVFMFLDSPPLPTTGENSAPKRTKIELLRTPKIAVAIICAMVSYALMNLVMTSTPIAVVGCGYGTGDAADVVMGHVLAMFAPSFFTGHLIARFGTVRIIASGLLMLAAAGAVALSGVTLVHFTLALGLLGLGWNFGFIGATVMLSSAHRPEERGRVQGMNDSAVFGLVGIASLASGGLMNCIGGDPVDGWAAVNLAMVPFLALAGAALLWLTITQPRTVP